MRFFIDSVQGDTADYAQVADIEVFGSGATVANGSVTPDPAYTDSGTITAPNPAAGDPTGLQNVFGVTGTEMNTACTFPPASQGADAWVTKFPLGFSDGLHSVSVKGTSDADETVGHDLDLYFLDSACQLTGSVGHLGRRRVGGHPARLGLPADPAVHRREREGGRHRGRQPLSRMPARHL